MAYIPGTHTAADQMRAVETVCPSCGGQGMSVFYETRQVPVHSVLLFPTQQQAVEYPRGDIELGVCPRCGFISNVVFDASKHEYSERYEETQGFSQTFQAFHRALATRLIEEYDLRQKTVIEIGCGKGEFLTLLCELGENTGIGFDPAYVEERNVSPAKDRMTFIRDFYSERYSHVHGDFVVCKMTLEHIPNVREFIGTVRRSLGDRLQTRVFFQIPNMLRIFGEAAFWDIYYEHCSYFSPGSLARLFRSCDFEVLHLETQYADQYLMIEAMPGARGDGRPLPMEESPESLLEEVRAFMPRAVQVISQWRQRIVELHAAGKRTVIWGGGSKGVTFLTTLELGQEIAFAVDVNPYRSGTFLGRTGHEIVAPESLVSSKPDAVIVMNPVYCKEIQEELDRLGIVAEVLPIHDLDALPEGAQR